MESLGTQLYAFGIVLLAGITLGLFFDLFRVIRGLLRPGVISTPILDLLFWALITPVLVLYLILANWGELRGYVIIGLLLGLFFYRLLLSGLVISLLLWLVRVIGGILNLVVSFVVWLVSFPILLVQEARFSWSHRKRASGASPRAWRLRPRLRWRK
jgi:spore cortex biosynthesis protein YabQ